jgi:alpha-beta hydrolase superfamily lysophospholipase
MFHLEPERFDFRSDDCLPIACVKWSGERNVRGVVQIAHGLGEHVVWCCDSIAVAVS